MKLFQNQLWKQGEDLYRIVVLERLNVEYKHIDPLDPELDKHHRVTKKEFCRLIKDATEVVSESL